MTQINKSILLVFLLLSSMFSYASHQAGADIYYTYLQNDKYELTFVLYRDCEGVYAPGSVSIDIYSLSCKIARSITLRALPNTGKEITPKCPVTNTSCTGGTYPGLEAYYYRDTIEIKEKCDDWVISWNSCCRNYAIKTINDPGGTDTYVEARLNNKDFNHNNSPIFSNKPITFVLIDQPFTFNHGALDPDGDSLAYSLIPPKTSSSSSVYYRNNFSYLQPITTESGVTINPITGDISFKPTVLGEISIFAVKVDEYRNGVFIGSVIRDMQIYIIACGGNRNPSLTGIDSTNNFSIIACEGDTVSFDVFSSDPDTFQIVTLEWNNGIKGGTFTVDGAQFPKGTFSWLPPYNSASNLPYVFTVTVKDNACPYNGFQIYSYSIYVKSGPNFQINHIDNINCKDSSLVTATFENASQIVSMKWCNGDTLSQTYAHMGECSLTVVNNIGCELTRNFNLENKLQAGFNFDNLCFGNETSFYDGSNYLDGNISKWIWSFGDGEVDTVGTKDITHKYQSAGSYSISLEVIGDDDCVDTFDTTVVLNDVIVPDFKFKNNCINDSVLFWNTSKPELVQFVSEWFDATQKIGDTNSIVHKFDIPQWHTIKMITRDQNNCTAQVSKNLYINENPKADFFVQAQCLYEPLQITNNSVMDRVIGMEWEIDTSHFFDTEPVYSFEEAGDHKITLTLINDSLCRDSMAIMTTIYAPDLSFVYKNACSDSLTYFKAQADVPDSVITGYYWDLGDGFSSDLSEVYHRYDTIGKYKVTLTITTNDGCTKVYSDSVGINPIPVADFIFENNCSYTYTKFLNESYSKYGNVGSYLWQLDGRSYTSKDINYRFNSPGVYPVSLKVWDNGGCASRVTKNVEIFEFPEVQFTYDSVCPGQEVQFIDKTIGGTNAIVARQWNFNDGTVSADVNPKHIFPGSKIYNVTLSLTNDLGCQDTYTREVNVSKPQISFIKDNVCVDSLALFVDNSKGTYDSKIIDWEWKFDDSTIVKNDSATYIYKSVQSYPVTLKVKDDFGCTDSISKLLRVYSLPRITYKWGKVCQLEQFTITNTTTYQEGDSIQFKWEMGDGFISDLSNPEYVYLSDGLKEITLWATNSNGCTASLTDTIEVLRKPRVEFIYDTVCLGQFTKLKIDKANTDIDILSKQWLINSNYYSTQDSLNFIFPGLFGNEAILSIESSQGCHASVSKTIPVSGTSVDFSFGPGCENSVTLFTDQSYSSVDNVAEYFWDFNNGEYGNDDRAVISFTESKNYNVKLVVTNERGCKDSIVKPFFVAPKLSVSINTSPACIGEDILFNCSPSSSAANIETYSWDFGDGTFKSEAKPVYAYQTNGIKNIALTYTDKYSCVSVVSKSIDVESIVSDILVSGSCESLNTLSENSAVSTGKLINFWDWTINGSKVSNQSVATLDFTGLNQVDVVLLVTSQSGCSNTVSKTIQVSKNPVVSIVNDPACLNSSVQFSVDQQSGSKIVNWNWNFNNVGGSVLEKPTTIFNSTGTKNITLSVTDEKNCKGQASKSILVDDATASFSYDLTCLNDDVQFTDNSVSQTSDIISWDWDFGNNLSSTIQNPKQSLSETETVVSLSVLSVNGCEDQISKTVKLNQNPVADFSTSGYCVGDNVYFDNKSDLYGIAQKSVSWYVDGQFVSDLNRYQTIFYQSGYVKVEMFVENINGCSDSASSRIQFDNHPKINFDIDEDSVCMGTVIKFESNVSYNNSYSVLWRFGDGDSATTATTSHIYGYAGRFYPKLKVTTSNGCSSDSVVSLPIIVSKNPVVDAGDDQVMLYGEMVILQGSSDVKNYWWTPEGFFTDNEVLEPIVSPTDTTIFCLNAKSSVGCKSKDCAKVFVYEEIKIEVPTAFSPNGDNANDELKILYSGVGILDYFQIYDRWGNLIFVSSDLEQGWDGTKDGELAENGVYVWSLRCRSGMLGSVYEKQGSVTLIR